ncbi:MAG TPA: THUMP domain-containing protein [Paludibacteraceae bacterium]|nr:THUMP domain-containing protein [Paludibacteraceae bacterium]
MEQEFQMTAKTFRGLEEVLAKELVNLGANNVSIERRVVSFTGDQRMMYKANLYCRTASRILRPILTFKATNADEVYEQVKLIDWSKYLDVKRTFAIDATVFSEEFRNSKFVTYRVKDAIADWFMEHENKRPSIRLDNPDLFLNIHISHNQCTLSLDSSGESLHKRGYRDAQTEAPINEALAAGMLLLAGWDGKSNFVDPMCGSGTFLIEAALIALNIPPCIYRKAFAFEKWTDFNKELFEELYNDDSAERPFEFKIMGADSSPRAVKIAQENIKAAGLNKYITVEQRAIVDWELQEEPCLIVTNPPYGERLLSDDLFGLYRQLGETLKHKFTGSTTWVISSHIDCLQSIGLKPSAKVKLLNGALDCEFWKYELFRGKRNDFVVKKLELRN